MELLKTHSYGVMVMQLEDRFLDRIRIALPEDPSFGSVFCKLKALKKSSIIAKEEITDRE